MREHLYDFLMWLVGQLFEQIQVWHVLLFFTIITLLDT